MVFFLGVVAANSVIVLFSHLNELNLNGDEVTTPTASS